MERMPESEAIAEPMDARRFSETTGSSRFIAVAAIAGLVACAGDFLVTIVLGFFYPNYNHLKLVMSELGTSQSPVAVWVGVWWVIGGAFLVFFAVGFRMAYAARKRSATAVTGLIMLFGLGAWVCGGLFPMEAGGLETTLAGKLHGICGGFGYLAIAFVPLVSLAVFQQRLPGMAGLPGRPWLSIGVFVLGLVFFALFVISEDAPSAAGMLSYTGLWQRLFLLDHYAYLGVISAMMIRLAQGSKRETA